MKFRPRRLLPSGATAALLATASLALPACTDTGYVSGGNTGYGSSNYGNSSYYRVTGRYYHCHPSGVCHNSRHPNFYYHSGYYRQRPPQRYQRPQPPPARPRPY